MSLSDTQKQHPWRARVGKRRSDLKEQVSRLKLKIEPNLIPQSALNTRLIAGCLVLGLVALSWDILENWDKTFVRFTESLSTMISGIVPVALILWYSGALLLGRNAPASWTVIFTMIACAYLSFSFWTVFRWSDLENRNFWIRLGLCAVWLALTAALLYRIWFGEAIPNRTRERGKEVKFRRSNFSERSDTENDSDVETPWAGKRAAAIPPALSVEQWWGGAHPRRPSDLMSPPPKGKIDNGLLFLASTKFLNCFTQEQFMDAYGKVEWTDLKEGETLFTKGDESEDGMYIVTSGTLGMFGPVGVASDSLICELGKGESVGDLEVITGEKRDFTCRASSACSLIHVTRALFQELSSTILVSYVKTYLARQWRIADYVLTDFWRMVPGGSRTNRYRVEGLEQFFTAEDPLFCAMEEAYKDSLKSPTPPAKEGIFEYQFSTVEAGELVFDVGACSEEKVYVLLKGKLAITYRGSHSRVEVGPGAVLGCLSYLTGTSKKSSTRALTRCVLAVLSSEHFAHPSPSILAMVNTVVETMAPTLRQFAQLGLQRGWRRAGETLYLQGTSCDDFFIIVAGRARVVSDNKTTPVVAGGVSGLASLVRDPRYFRYEIGRGESVGEMTFLGGKEAKHTASVIAIRDLDLVRVSRAAFELIKARHPDAVVKISTVMAEKYTRMMAGLASPFVLTEVRFAAEGVPLHNYQQNAIVIALLPSPSANLNVFASHLARALAVHGPTLCLNREKVDTVLGSGTTASIGEFFHRNRFSCWMAEQEEAQSFILLEVEPEVNAWSRVCIRCADLIMLVADAGDSPAVSTFEQASVWDESSVASVTLCRKQLVLLHPKETVIPQGTRRWFARRRLDTYHHIRMHEAAHYARLARILANKAVGVVLSGGGARGLAHLGTLQTLYESKIPVDYVGGTSQGSLMGALWALRPVECQEDLQAFAAKVTELSQKMGSVLSLLSDATWPIMSYFEGKVFGETISTLLGVDVQVEDLWIKYFAITTNVTKADQEVHRLGTLWKAVRGSMTLLSFLPPMQVDGELLIDGGYVNNFPCDVMKKACQPRFIIGVDVENKAEPHLVNVSPYGNSLSGTWLVKKRLWNLVNPFSERFHIPRYSELVQSLLYINHNRTVRNQLTARLMDLYICPDLGDTQLLDYHKMQHIVELGMKCAKPLVQEFRAKNAHLLPSPVPQPILEEPLNRWSSLCSLTVNRPEQMDKPELMQRDVSERKSSV